MHSRLSLESKSALSKVAEAGSSVCKKAIQLGESINQVPSPSPTVVFLTAVTLSTVNTRSIALKIHPYRRTILNHGGHDVPSPRPLFLSIIFFALINIHIFDQCKSQSLEILL
jgi:hypothetical protein